MKKNILLIISVFAILAGTFSCKKNNVNKPTYVNITATIKVNQSYQYDLGGFGDEEGASITKQANHFTTSKIEREINTGKIVYYYTPVINYTDTDEVELKSIRGSNGSSVGNNIIITTIKITVTN